jgi:hypothetical protein
LFRNRRDWGGGVFIKGACSLECRVEGGVFPARFGSSGGAIGVWGGCCGGRGWIRVVRRGDEHAGEEEKASVM